MRGKAVFCVAASVALFVRCGEKRNAVAADAPRLEVRGAVASAQVVNAIAVVDGRIATIAVKEGSAVSQGDVVATIVNPAIDRDLAYARAQVAIAEQRLRAARTPPPTRSAGDAGARERAAAQVLKNREAKRDRYRALFKSRDVSQEELENAENEYALALRDWLAERERRTTIAVQTDTSLLQLELERARAEEAFVAERKTYLNVTAPVAGIVTRVYTRPGENIFVRDPIVEVSNTTTVEVRGAIAPELLRHVRPGMAVEVKVFTVPPRRFNVPIRAIVPGAGGATLVVDLPNPDAVLQAGQQAVITVR